LWRETASRVHLGDECAHELCEYGFENGQFSVIAGMRKAPSKVHGLQVDRFDCTPAQQPANITIADCSMFNSQLL
jgi:hypothetical protein